MLKSLHERQRGILNYARKKILLYIIKLGTIPTMRHAKRLKYSTIESEVDTFPINWQGRNY